MPNSARISKVGPILQVVSGTIIIQAKKKTNYILYKAFVEAFTQRNITHAQDVMDAFAGISKIFEHRFRSTLCFGIPQTALEFLILWQRSGFLQRRTVQVDGTTFPIFPSWSWANWIGKATYRMTFPFQKKIDYEYCGRRTGYGKVTTSHRPKKE